MPNIDGGHYFFTALIPIDNRGIVEHAGLKSSPVHMVRDALEALPTALQSPASEKIGIQSPFARSLRTHFARLFVLDAPNYNGRDPQDSIITALPISKTDLLKAQPVDGLATPYLVFVSDFDPQGVEPHSWLEELWTLARPELCSVFEYCYGFDPAFDAGAFARYVVQGQVETTMPFNDYWTVPPPLPSLTLGMLAVPLALGFIAGLLLGWRAGWPWWGWLLAALALTALGVYVSYLWVMARGARPFPAAPHASLRNVLKALYLQQAFARFAADNQGAAPAQLRAAFDQFVADARLDDLDDRTQPPGVVRSAIGGA
jgi:hypothetical protein